MDKKLGHAVTPKPGNWVQTERSAHIAWAQLIGKKPKAAILLHHLVAAMGSQNAVIISQGTLAKMIGCSLRTVQYAVETLVAGRWIEAVQVGKGTTRAYVVNSRVAWAQKRENLRLSTFHAVVVADYDEQEEALLGFGDLRKLPSLYPLEMQLPTGDGEPPPSQPCIEGLEPDLPSLQAGSPPPEGGGVLQGG